MQKKKFDVGQNHIFDITITAKLCQLNEMTCSYRKKNIVQLHVAE